MVPLQYLDVIRLYRVTRFAGGFQIIPVKGISAVFDRLYMIDLLRFIPSTIFTDRTVGELCLPEIFPCLTVIDFLIFPLISQALLRELTARKAARPFFPWNRQKSGPPSPSVENRCQIVSD